MNIIDLAFEIAQKAHLGQVDKAGIDYFEHPKKVASFVESDEEKAVAYLHDVIEDTAVTLKDLHRAGVPEAVISAVNILTKQKNQDYWAYLKRVKENPFACKVKLADLKHNSDLSRLAVINEEDEVRLAKYKAAIEYLRT